MNGTSEVHAALRTDGVYRGGTKTWLRMLGGGGVLGAFLQPNMSAEAAAKRLHPGLGGLGTGTVSAIEGGLRIEFQFPAGVWVYEGGLEDGALSMWWVKDGKRKSAITFHFEPLDAEALAPPQEARVHQLRARLANGELASDRAEAAAAIGDPVAALACRPFFDVKEVSRRFAGLGREACLRVLLALCWSDDGQWYEPKQGVAKDGSRKCDEGKVLRSIAKWCVKPSSKLVSKAQTDYGDVVRVGPAYQYLDAMMRVLLAENEDESAAAMQDALTLHLAQDVIGGYELVRKKVVPWLLGTGDPLAEMVARVK